MSSATNVEATAVNTIEWLRAPHTNIVVPVYQRQYRWDIGGCEQLLADIRAIAGEDDGAGRAHFIGSILSAPSGHVDELVLIDGQQRITTLMLLIAALEHTVAETDPALAAELHTVLVRAGAGTRTKLRPHLAWAATFERVIHGGPRENGDAGDSRFDINYAFFRSQIGLEEAPRIWRGLRGLEHVSITLGPSANAQQIFESLNSTGEPLRDHELIHNYMLMGLSHAQQLEIEDTYWLPIEQNTGEAIASFWRHYLVMLTGREVAVAGERGVYGAFHEYFPRLDATTLPAAATQWREYSEIYRTMLEPHHALDTEIGQQLRWLNTFGKSMYPLVMAALHDYQNGRLEKALLLRTIEYAQALLLRRTIVGMPLERLVARLCRARRLGQDALEAAMGRITPSDERVRVGLKYGELPHATAVLSRLAGLDSAADLGLEHVVPIAPGPQWSGDGERGWRDYTEDEQNSHRALSKTLGNLTLLEEPLAMQAMDLSYPTKRDRLYARSDVSIARSFTEVAVWNTAAIAARTEELTASFVRIWARPPLGEIDDDGLTPILDAIQRRGWPRGWEREFSYVEYCGEHWEVPDVKYLFNRIFKRLWADDRDAVTRFSARRGGPLYGEMAWTGEWDTLADGVHLYMGWDAKYMLGALQGLLTEADIAADVFVKYSYIGQAMD